VILDLTSLTTELLTKLLKKLKLLIGLDLKLILKPKEKVSSQRELPSNLPLKEALRILERIANERTMSGDSFNRPVCGAVRYRER